ncbi:hypothetical protein IMY05_C4559000900 [Salix suchowensis]|nr:hypothetical protein IMY05_C4559000900 [Salix suchowensis]
MLLKKTGYRSAEGRACHYRIVVEKVYRKGFVTEDDAGRRREGEAEVEDRQQGTSQKTRDQEEWTPATWSGTPLSTTLVGTPAPSRSPRTSISETPDLEGTIARTGTPHYMLEFTWTASTTIHGHDVSLEDHVFGVDIGGKLPPAGNQLSSILTVILGLMEQCSINASNPKIKIRHLSGYLRRVSIVDFNEFVDPYLCSPRMTSSHCDAHVGPAATAIRTHPGSPVLEDLRRARYPLECSQDCISTRNGNTRCGFDLGEELQQVSNYRRGYEDMRRTSTYFTTRSSMIKAYLFSSSFILSVWKEARGLPVSSSA